jgi:hypothetical protein
MKGNLEDKKETAYNLGGIYREEISLWRPRDET